MIQFELLEFFNASAPFYCGLKAFNIGQYLYKIRDDSIKLRNFLGINNVDDIEAIFSDHEGHFLYKFINEDELLHPIIDFDLSVETLNAINSKISDKQDVSRIGLWYWISNSMFSEPRFSLFSMVPGLNPDGGYGEELLPDNILPIVDHYVEMKDETKFVQYFYVCKFSNVPSKGCILSKVERAKDPQVSGSIPNGKEEGQEGGDISLEQKYK
ncbi:hypothetical protein C1645_822619 [Glomus cerebriforme]|uniref:Uncharacterized protein n=1 Tax=Glomus cerebriforme TaxID=658196 RepID=A0A397SZL8_9GLOM|nr:hypothetical protein C1645_822619 [Glomus cerebriforme]